MEDLISVIVPVYNTEPYLEKCLRSLLAQTYENIEIIAVNDGSPDGSLTILQRFASKDPRIKVINRENGGLSAARNTGLDAACGKWLMFVDSDDFVDPDFCAYSLKRVMEKNAEIGIVSYRIMTPEGTMEGPKVPIENNLLTRDQAMQRLSWFGLEHFMWNKIFRKDIFEGIRFPEGELWEDIAVLYLLIDRANRVSLSDKQLYTYFRHPGSIMGSKKFRSYKWPYLQTKKQYRYYKENYPDYAHYMHTMLAILGLNYTLQLSARRDPYPMVKEEQKFLREIPGQKVFRWKQKVGYWLLCHFPYCFYLVVGALYHKNAVKDD